MARATTLSACVFDLSPTKHLHYSSLSPPANLSFHHQIPRLSIICNAQLDGSTGEDPDEIGETFFDDMMTVDDDDEDEQDDAESSIDLFIRFLQTLFKKLSKRAKKASRSLLPAAISPQLVSFAVDGILLLAALSIVKALLEVVCTLGGTVFVVILLLRVIWAAAAYFQSNSNNFNQGGNSFRTT
ncbi:hypothetical protein LWI29_023498 [Acer saccharum]|uniref:Uncharacterized protein n=1 Tax=Acer saccharum TaxID=4024 RepID=A0AA39VBQ6_ACESA|nr:hypothetical protein LWI29_023498 [Acer saccharum]KAK1552082.1 hypothetical protein Q3G72_010044 [Acer saccharum]